MHTTSSLRNKKVWHCKQNQMASYTNLIFPLAVLSLLLLPFPSHSCDPCPLQDFCVADLNSSIFVNGHTCIDPSEVVSRDFVSSGFAEEPLFGENKTLASDALTVTEFPALNTLGMSMNRVSFRRRGSINPPHTHPRATEISYLEKGRIIAAWISTNNTVYANIVRAGQVFVVPRGLLHFELTILTQNASFISSYNSQNPGYQTLGLARNTTLTFADEVLSNDLLVNEGIIDLIKSKLSEM